MEIGFFLLQYAAPQGIAAFVPPTGISFFCFKFYDYGCNFQFFFVMLYTGFGFGEQVNNISVCSLERSGNRNFE